MKRLIPGLTPALTPALTAALAAALIAACSVLPSPPPVQLYRFGSPEAAAPAPRAGPARVALALRPVRFDTAARGDRILGVTGTEAAYIGGARWLSPADDLYADSLEAAFAGQSGAVRLIGRREVAPEAAGLDVEITVFEARYPAPGAAPTVIVSAHVRLLDGDRRLKAEQGFTVEQPAEANRVSAIVAAFDGAVNDLNARIVAWTDANVR